MSSYPEGIDRLVAPNWTRSIAADLVQEIEHDIGDSIETIPEMRLFLAVKAYRLLHDAMNREREGKSGVVALKAMALAARRFAKDRPGLFAATFRSPVGESKEWMDGSITMRQLFTGIFLECGLDETAAVHALRMLRSLVRGFVVNEMSGSFHAAASNDESYELAIDVFICGLPVLMEQPRQPGRLELPHSSGDDF